MKKQGKHPHNALTDRFCKTCGVGIHNDGDGLLLAHDSHGKRWLFRYTHNGRRREMGLGSFRHVSLKKGRELRSKNRTLLIDGIDPIDQKRYQNKVVPTFKQAALEVHLQRLPTWKSTKHAAQWINTLTEYAFPHFGDLPVNRVGTPEGVKALSPIWLTKHETAKRVRQRVGSVLDWAKAHGYRIGDNPMETVHMGLPDWKGEVESHAALAHEDVKDFIKSLHKSQAGDLPKLAFEFLILTATRSGEVRLATWNEIDFDAREWTIPKTRMKARQEHKVPLSDRCIEILQEAQKYNGVYIFPGRNIEKPLSDMAFTMILRRMGVEATAHGFRSAFRDWAEEKTDFKRSAIEASLAHKIAQSETEGAYLRTKMFSDRVKLMDEWCEYCYQ